MKILVSIILIIGTILIGGVLTRLGKPYTTGLFTIHKIFALTYIIMVGMIIKNHLKTESISVLFIVALVLLIISTLGLFASGTMMSIGISHHKLLRIIHIISTSSLVVGFGLLIVYMKM